MEDFQLFTIEYLWICHRWLLSCSLYTTLVRVFNYECMLSLIKWFFCIYWDDHVVSVFSFVNVVYNSIDWLILNHPYNSGLNQLDNSAWPFLCIVGFSLLIFYLFRILIYSHQRHWICIFVVSLVSSNCSFIEWLWKFSHLFNLWNKLENDRYEFFFVYLVEYPAENHLILNFCLQGSFWFVFITESILLLVISLFKLFLWLSFGRLYVFKNLYISSRLSNLLAYNYS